MSRRVHHGIERGIHGITGRRHHGGSYSTVRKNKSRGLKISGPSADAGEVSEVSEVFQPFKRVNCLTYLVKIYP